MKIVGEALVYPFRGCGKYLLLVGAVISMLMQFAALVPMLGLISSVLFGGYFMAVYFEIIQTTATGSNEAPRFPNVADLVGDLLAPLAKVIGVIVISFSPLFLYQWLNRHGIIDERVAYGLLGFGLVYLPMAMLAVVVLGHMGVALPHVVLPSIFKAGFLYWLAVGLLGGLFYLSALLDHLLGNMSLVSWIITAVFGMYLLMANGRILGLVYREKEDELNWC